MSNPYDEPKRDSNISTVKLNRSHILTINGGSSSLKFAIFEASDPPNRIRSGRIERVGQGGTRLIEAGHADRIVEALDLKAGAQLVMDWVEQSVGFATIGVVGHRVVHGGSRYHRPEQVDDELMAELHRLITLDPDHLPGEIALIEAFQSRDPELTQVACFDTAFHHEMPKVAQILAIPRRYEAAGVRRYGFHGLSYAFMMEELIRVAGPEAGSGRVILAHLGAGASLAAIQNGRCMDTSMGFTPSSGLMMATRSGNIDPGLIRFLAQTEGMTAERFDHLVNRESGLLGVSETSSDVRDLLAQQSSDPRAAEAIELFCYQAKKWIGGFSAVLGGLESLVFAGGIGENAPEIRQRICDGLSFLGIEIDQSRNESGAGLISTDASPTKVRIIRTDEELMIAKAAAPFSI